MITKKSRVILKSHKNRTGKNCIWVKKKPKFNYNEEFVNKYNNIIMLMRYVYGGGGVGL